MMNTAGFLIIIKWKFVEVLELLRLAKENKWTYSGLLRINRAAFNVEQKKN